ncbi:MAG: sensor histidine kinase [Acidimicrobiia bacterium]
MTGEGGRADLQRALARFTYLQEEQRRMLAKAIHDHTIQPVVATLWALDDLAESSGEGPERDVIVQARANLREAIASARSLISELRPPLLDELGLVAAVEQQLVRLAEDTGLEVSLVSDLAWRLPPHLETLAFRTTEEALRNVRRHASASTVSVHVHGEGATVEVVVDDDGVGVPFDALARAAGDGHVGLIFMRETIAMAGGTFTVGLRPTGGTRLSFTLPAEPGPED